jgi:inner membrane protein
MSGSIPVVQQVDRLVQVSGRSGNVLALRHEMIEQLSCLSLRAFEECLKHLFTRLGYEQVRLTGRTAMRGRTLLGGREIEAVASTGITTCRVIIQVKQYRRTVSRRFVDELRGTMSRLKASHGIIVTTSDFADRARLSAQSDRRLAVTLMDGADLLDALMSVELGVSRKSNRCWRLDQTYFDHLHEQFPRSRVRRSSRTHVKASRNRKDIRTQASPNEKSGDESEGGPVTWRTHVLAGTSAVWMIGFIPDTLTLDTLGISLLAAAFGALLPDLDASDAKVRTLGIGGIRPFVPISEGIFRTWGHRGPLHSYLGLVGAAAAAVIFARALSWEIGLAFWLGYASHLAADACTKSGIPLFSASSKGPRFHLLPSPLRFRTGSQAEDMLLPFLAVATALLVFTHLPH